MDFAYPRPKIVLWVDTCNPRRYRLDLWHEESVPYSHTRNNSWIIESMAHKIIGRNGMLHTNDVSFIDRPLGRHDAFCMLTRMMKSQSSMTTPVNSISTKGIDPIGRLCLGVHFHGRNVGIAELDSVVGGVICKDGIIKCRNKGNTRFLANRMTTPGNYGITSSGSWTLHVGEDLTPQLSVNAHWEPSYHSSSD